MVTEGCRPTARWWKRASQRGARVLVTNFAEQIDPYDALDPSEPCRDSRPGADARPLVGLSAQRQKRTSPPELLPRSLRFPTAPASRRANGFKSPLGHNGPGCC